MIHRQFLAPTVLVLLFGCFSTASAQMPDRPILFAIDALAAGQGKAGLDGGGSFTANRVFGRVGGLYRFEGGSVGLFLGAGQIDYDFGSTIAPWDTVRDESVNIPFRLSVGQAEIFVAPGLRYDYEDGADREDGRTWGAFAGIGWRFSETLTLGPAFGAYTEIGSDDLDLFPAILVDWQITDRARLTTGPTVGATQGPGLAFDYAVTEDLRLGVAGRFENIRFRLNDKGPAPGGIGQDRSFPLVLTLDYAPFPGSRLAAFAGAEFGGELRLEDASGALVEMREYDPAPIIGVAFRFGF